MQAAGVLIEYNPMHMGHAHLLAELRRQLGAETAVVCAMSGDFVQRGDFAVVNRRARAEAAVRSGVDLVLELPLPWAIAPAERFADGGMQVLLGTGVVEHVAFGSECGDAAALGEVASCLLSPAFDEALRRELKSGRSYAACRQAAVGRLLGAEKAALLESPNNILGIEYCKSLLRRKSAVRPLTIRRLGAAHDAPDTAGQTASASAIRALLLANGREEALGYMTPAMQAVYLREEAAGRAPVSAAVCQRSILARLRTMEAADFAALDEGREGLGNRLYEASRTAVSVEAVLEAAKTKRYAYARLRRMVLWAYLGLRPAQFPESVPYLRVLAANAVGRRLLGHMRETAAVPVLTKPADVRLLGPEAQALLALEARAADLYALAYPDLSAAVGGSLWREGPVIV